MGLDAFADRFHDLQVDAQKIVAAHAGLARHAGGHDAHIGARDIGVIVGALHRGIEAFRGSGLGNIEGLALRRAFSDVEKNDVAHFLECCEVGERAADLTRADQRDPGSGHGSVSNPYEAVCPARA